MSTLFLAAAIGWYLVICGVLLLVRHQEIKLAMTDILGQQGSFFILAIFTLVLGLLMVTSHNIWVEGWPVVITIFSWLVLIGALFRLFFPDVAIKMGRSYIRNPNKMKIFAAVFLLIGFFLLTHVYYQYI